MLETDLVRLRHMLDACREALSFVKDRKQTDLYTDRMLLLSLVKEIEIIDEAAIQVSDPCRRDLPPLAQTLEKAIPSGG